MLSVVLKIILLTALAASAEPATIVSTAPVWAPLLASALSSGGMAFLGSKERERARKEQAANTAESKRQFDLQFGLQKENQPFEQLSALEAIRKTLGAPSGYDFLSAMNARVTGK